MTGNYAINAPAILGSNSQIQKAIKIIDKISTTNSAVLIIGESGTGKELVARTIHDKSTRSSNPFIVVYCSGFSEIQIENELFGCEKSSFDSSESEKIGAFENANSGTIVLKDISGLNNSTQFKILNVMSTKLFRRVGGNTNIRVDVRIIATSKNDLFYHVKQGNFRDELFYRLNVITIKLPNLVEIKYDIKLFIDSFIYKYCTLHGLPISRMSPEALHMLESYVSDHRGGLTPNP